MLLMPRRKNNEFDLVGDVFRDDPFFDDFTPRKRPHHGPEMLKTDVEEKDDSYVFKVELPGIEKDDIKISVDSGYLEITAEAKEEVDENKKKYVCKERYFGTFSRSFYVGEDITTEDVKASFKNGLLVLTVPKQVEKELPEKKFVTID